MFACIYHVYIIDHYTEENWKVGDMTKLAGDLSSCITHH